MPRFKIETSLFEPVTVEVEGGQTYESAPLSDRLIRETTKLGEQRKAKTLDDQAYVIQMVGLIFGLKPEEAEIIDVRILGRMVEFASEAMSGGKAGKVAEVVAPDVAVSVEPIDEVTAEKNAPKPGSEPTP